VFHHRGAFWAGVVAVSVGVVLHFPMYVGARDMQYQLSGMPMDTPMRIGMALIVAGLILAAYGLIPRGRGEVAEQARRIRVQALDDAPIRLSHVLLIVVMATAVTIDVMKPTTLAFVLPGMTAEYDLRGPLNPDGGRPVALLPFFALLGMVSGSFCWGWLGDRVGRRASILLAGLMFIATSICGAMPGFSWNLLMCFLMGAAVGGMLPIAFALLAETIPAGHRGWLMVLIGGDVAGAYVLTSYLSSVLEPRFSWRALWLIGLPTGMLILLNRWIPESPRFLIATGRTAQAEQIMTRFGARIVTEEAAQPRHTGGFRTLFGAPLLGLTGGVALFGLGWGLVNNGFLLWLPTNLRRSGFDVASADRLLAQSALVGLPAVFVVAALYGRWSSKHTMVGFAVLNATVLAGFAVLGERVGSQPLLLQAMVVVLLASTSALLAMLTPYSSEVYPTHIRARGTGLAGMCARSGGFLAVALVMVGIAQPTLRGAALIGAVPTALAAFAVARYGVETRRRRLEEITAAEGIA
jgi:MFS transporter, putative metabolite:H+ symporter